MLAQPCIRHPLHERSVGPSISDAVGAHRFPTVVESRQYGEASRGRVAVLLTEQSHAPYTCGMSDCNWLYDLPSGLPSNFDYSLVRTTDDACSMIWRLPNADRGKAAAELYDAREVVGHAVAYEGLMAAWDHDHGHVLAEFGDDQFFADALSDVAPPLRLPNPIRLV